LFWLGTGVTPVAPFQVTNQIGIIHHWQQRKWRINRFSQHLSFHSLTFAMSQTEMITEKLICEALTAADEHCAFTTVSFATL